MSSIVPTILVDASHMTLSHDCIITRLSSKQNRYNNEAIELQTEVLRNLSQLQLLLVCEFFKSHFYLLIRKYICPKRYVREIKYSKNLSDLQ